MINETKIQEKDLLEGAQNFDFTEYLAVI